MRFILQLASNAYKAKALGVALVYVFALFPLGGCVSIIGDKETEFTSAFNAGNYNLAASVYPTEYKEASQDTENQQASSSQGIELVSSMPYLPALNTATAALMAKEHAVSSSYFELALNDIFKDNLDGYDPKYYEKIMLNVYSGLNSWQNKDISSARVDFNRAYSAQGDAVRENASAIAKLEKEAKSKAKKNKLDISKSLAATNTEVAKLTENFKDLSAYKDFANPYASYLAGLFLILNRASPSDLENGINYLKRVQTMMPSNPYIIKDLQMAEGLATDKGSKETVWVIYEQGLAPVFEKVRFSIPLYFSHGLKFATMALPEIKTQADAYKELSIISQNSSGSDRPPVKTALLADIDKIVAVEYKARLPYEVTKALLWMAINLAVQEGLQQSTKNTDGAFLGGLASLIISQISNPVETNSWKSMPKTVSIARFDMPQTRKISLFANDYAISEDIKFKKKTKYAIVYVRIPTKDAKPAVTVAEFKK